MKNISFEESSVLQEFARIMSDKGLVKEASSVEEVSELESLEERAIAAVSADIEKVSPKLSSNNIVLALIKIANNSTNIKAVNLIDNMIEKISKSRLPPGERAILTFLNKAVDDFNDPNKGAIVYETTGYENEAVASAYIAAVNKLELIRSDTRNLLTESAKSTLKSLSKQIRNIKKTHAPFYKTIDDDGWRMAQSAADSIDNAVNLFDSAIKEKEEKKEKVDQKKVGDTSLFMSIFGEGPLADDMNEFIEKYAPHVNDADTKRSDPMYKLYTKSKRIQMATKASGPGLRRFKNIIQDAIDKSFEIQDQIEFSLVILNRVKKSNTKINLKKTALVSPSNFPHADSLGGSSSVQEKKQSDPRIAQIQSILTTKYNISIGTKETPSGINGQWNEQTKSGLMQAFKKTKAPQEYFQAILTEGGNAPSEGQLRDIVLYLRSAESSKGTGDYDSFQLDTKNIPHSGGSSTVPFDLFTNFNAPGILRAITRKTEGYLVNLVKTKDEKAPWYDEGLTQAIRDMSTILNRLGTDMDRDIAQKIQQSIDDFESYVKRLGLIA